MPCGIWAGPLTPWSLIPTAVKWAVSPALATHCQEQMTGQRQVSHNRGSTMEEAGQREGPQAEKAPLCSL